jgi:cytosine/adenosine deaminase-related metal-dependent hydrolase
LARDAARRNNKEQDLTTTLIRNCRFAIVWDDETQSHAYRSHVDVAMTKDRIAFIGQNYQGESDRVMDGANWLVMPGLIDIHSHPFSEPMNKGMWDEVGSLKLCNTSLYEYLPILNPDGVKASYGVALSEVLLSGVTTASPMALASEPGTPIRSGKRGAHCYLNQLLQDRTHRLIKLRMLFIIFSGFTLAKLVFR